MTRRSSRLPAAVALAAALSFSASVHAKREAVVITKRGKPVAKLVPIQEEKDEIFGFLKGKGKVVGDVVSPAITREEWGDLY